MPTSEKWAFFLAILMLFVLIGSETNSAINKYYTIKRLQERGVETIAKISELHVVNHKYGHSNTVAYAYEDKTSTGSSSASKSGDDDVTDAEYASLVVGQDLPIVYDPQNFDRSEINLHGDFYDKNPIDPIKSKFDKLLYLLFILIGIIWSSKKRKYKTGSGDYFNR